MARSRMETQVLLSSYLRSDAPCLLKTTLVEVWKVKGKHSLYHYLITTSRLGQNALPVCTCVCGLLLFLLISVFPVIPNYPLMAA